MQVITYFRYWESCDEWRDAAVGMREYCDRILLLLRMCDQGPETRDLPIETRVHQLVVARNWHGAMEDTVEDAEMNTVTCVSLLVLISWRMTQASQQRVTLPPRCSQSPLLLLKTKSSSSECRPGGRGRGQREDRLTAGSAGGTGTGLPHTPRHYTVTHSADEHLVKCTNTECTFHYFR